MSSSQERQSIYDAYMDIHEKKKESDLIFRIMMDESTDEIDKILIAFLESSKKEFPKLSSRFIKVATRTIEEKHLCARTAKHGVFFLFLFLNKEYADSLIASPPQVDPQKFKNFYENHLPKLCNMLLDSTITSLQDFVERTRSIYFKI